MLRITRFDDDPSQTLLRLEGKLTGPWVGELRRVVGELPDATRCRLDLAAVTYADSDGVQLLAELLRRGVAPVACSGLLAAMLPMESSP